MTMVLELALKQEEIILAIAIGIFARTVLYFYAKKNENKTLGEQIPKFELKYITTAILAGTVSFFLASLTVDEIMSQIPNAENMSAGYLAIMAAGLAFGSNEAVNKVISMIGLERILASNRVRSNVLKSERNNNNDSVIVKEDDDNTPT